MKRSGPLERRTPMPRGEAQLRRGAPIPRSSASLLRRAPLRAVSTKRAAENRVRVKVVKVMFANHPLCVWAGCHRLAVHPHEPLTRARGGSITDPANIVGLCSEHHRDAHTTKQLEAEALGLLIHSWNRGKQ